MPTSQAGPGAQPLVPSLSSLYPPASPPPSLCPATRSVAVPQLEPGRYYQLCGECVRVLRPANRSVASYTSAPSGGFRWSKGKPKPAQFEMQKGRRYGPKVYTGAS